MKSDNPAVTGPAMGLIKNVAPVTWLKMNEDADWEVHVLDPADDHSYDVIEEQAEGSFATYFALLYQLNHGAGGITPEGAERPWTDLNMPLLHDFADQLGVPVAHVVASVLVHEFTHHSEQTGETAAFQAEIAFDRDLGDTALLRDRIAESRNDPADYGSTP